MTRLLRNVGVILFVFIISWFALAFGHLKVHGYPESAANFVDHWRGGHNSVCVQRKDHGSRENWRRSSSFLWPTLSPSMYAWLEAKNIDAPSNLNSVVASDGAAKNRRISNFPAPHESKRIKFANSTSVCKFLRHFIWCPSPSLSSRTAAEIVGSKVCCRIADLFRLLPSQSLLMPDDKNQKQWSDVGVLG